MIDNSSPFLQSSTGIVPMLTNFLVVLVLALATDPGSATEPTSIPHQGLRWSFDDRLMEESPRHLAGSERSTIGYTDSPIGGKALRLDGKGSSMLGPAASQLDLAGKDFTIAAWIKSDGQKQAGIACLGGYSWRHGWLLDMHPDGSLRLELSAPEGKHFDTILSGSGVIVPGRWCHVAAVVLAGPRPGPSRLYVNGFEIASKTFDPVDVNNTRAVLTIGGIENATWASFPGLIDEVRLFSRALDEAEIVGLVEPGRGLVSKPEPGPINWEGIAPWASKVGPLDRFADRLPSPPRVPFESGTFALRPGEVVAFTGPTNAVLDQQQGWLETLLASATREHRPVFRPMGWEGDTVYEQWRAMNFGGWGSQFDAVGVSAIVAWFGQVEALDDSKTDREFTEAYGKLLDEFRAATPRLVVIAPTPFETPTGRWVPDNTGCNGRVRAFAEVARRLALERGAVFVDLYSPLAARGVGEPRLTEDGMHFTPQGLRIVAELIARRLGLDAKVEPALEPLRREIVAKNRLWFDCWRTMNWFFAYGDRTTTDFPRPAGGQPGLARELERYKPLLRASDDRIQALALGQTVAQPRKPSPAPSGIRQDPTEELKSFTLREGFEVNLFASEADGLVKPIQIGWDERGRLWALCVPSYPQLVPGVAANDYILVCEDTDGDGRADRFTKAAEGLVMPTGMALGDGGIYVCEATQLIYLSDLDGNGKFEHRRVIYSGFGTGDSHQMINSLCWGPDGRLWFTQGLHIFSRVETPWGLVRSGKTTIWRMDPRTLRLDPFLGNAAATENAWGVGFDDWGRAFYEPGNDPVTIYLDPALVPLPVEQLAYGQYHDVGMLARSKAKAMRVEFIGTRHLLDDLQGALVKSVYLGGQVELHRLTQDGAGFSSSLIGPLISSTSDAFRPVETRVGPDGALYVCDWYNPIIGHYQASYREPRRDHDHGRIWRITYKGRPLVKATALEGSNPARWLDQLRSPERWVREQARRLLFSAPSSEVIASADAWLEKDQAGNAPVSPHLLGEIIGIYAAHQEVRPALLRRLLESPEPRARAVGTRMIGRWADRLPNPLGLLRTMVVDDSALVRMEAIVSASYVRSSAAVGVVTLAPDRPRDRFIDYALTQAVRALKPEWYPALLRGDLELESRPDRLRFVLEADGTADVAKAVRRLAGADGLGEPGRERLLALLADVGNPDDLRYAFDRGRRSVPVLQGLVRAAQVRRQVPSGDLIDALRTILTDPDEAVRVEGIVLAGLWGTRPLAVVIRDVLRKPDAPESVIRASLGTLAALDGRDALPMLIPFASSSRPQAVLVAAVEAIGRVDLELGARTTAGLMSRVDDEARMTDLIRPVLGRKGGGEALAKALADVDLPPDPARLAHRATTAIGGTEPALLAILNQALGVDGRVPGFDAGLVKRLADDARTRGDAARGRRVFDLKLANCAACHRIGDRGGDVGPDLSSVGTGLPAESIVESVFWPNRQTKEGYLATRVATTDGRIVVGYKVKDSAEGIELRDPYTRQLLRVARAEIEEMNEVGSLMPEGLTVGMTSEEVRDLIRFLGELGRWPTK
jgi:putative heme-binding domain-containing protein